LGLRCTAAEAKGADPLMTLLDDSHLTDPGLVAEVHMGRREAFSELYRRYYSGALRYALGMTRGDETRAQDIVSEAFTRVFRAVSRNGNIHTYWHRYATLTTPSCGAPAG
jgi:hypothetical protein